MGLTLIPPRTLKEVYVCPGRDRFFWDDDSVKKILAGDWRKEGFPVEIRPDLVRYLTDGTIPEGASSGSSTPSSASAFATPVASQEPLKQKKRKREETEEDVRADFEDPLRKKLDLLPLILVGLKPEFVHGLQPQGPPGAKGDEAVMKVVESMEEPLNKLMTKVRRTQPRKDLVINHLQSFVKGTDVFKLYYDHCPESEQGHVWRPTEQPLKPAGEDRMSVGVKCICCTFRPASLLVQPREDAKENVGKALNLEEDAREAAEVFSWITKAGLPVTTRERRRPQT